MLEVNTAATDSTVVLDDYPYETPRTSWRVQSVQACDGYRLNIKFRDGLTGTVVMKELIESEDAGVFGELRDGPLFTAVAVVFGAVTWPNGADLAPDAMYDEIKRNGTWVLR